MPSFMLLGMEGGLFCLSKKNEATDWIKLLLLIVRGTLP